MTRRPDWQQALGAFLAAKAGRRFEWGCWDCCLFVADAIEAMTGVDIAASFRGEYRTYRDALKLMRRRCGDWPLEITVEKVAEEYGMAEIAVARAQRGDMVLASNGRRLVMGIVALNGRELIVLSHRLMRAPMSAARRAWRV